MRKFYVTCGELTAIVLGLEQWHACKKAIELWDGGVELAEWFYVSEAGFRYNHFPAYNGEPCPYCIETDSFVDMLDDLDYD